MNATPQNVASTSIEQRVSGIGPVRKEAWRATDLLRLYGEFMRDDQKRTERLGSYGPKGYGTGQKVNLDERHIRGFLYVVGHERYREYEPQLISIYVQRSGDSFADERCAEFVLALDAALDKVPFVENRNPDQVVEAEDPYSGLIPLTTCALALDIHRSTLHRWIENGLGAVRHAGIYKAVQKIGSHYYVNFMAVIAWKEQHHQSGKKRKKKKSKAA